MVSFKYSNMQKAESNKEQHGLPFGLIYLAFLLPFCTGQVKLWQCYQLCPFIVKPELQCFDLPESVWARAINSKISFSLVSVTYSLFSHNHVRSRGLRSQERFCSFCRTAHCVSQRWNTTIQTTFNMSIYELWHAKVPQNLFTYRVHIAWIYMAQTGRPI